MSNSPNAKTIASRQKNKAKSQPKSKLFDGTVSDSQPKSKLACGGKSSKKSRSSGKKK